jgi:histidinol-phosphate aminotransferase
MINSRRDFLGATARSAVFPTLVGLTRARPQSGLSIDWGYPEGAIRVGLNENPLGPSPRAIRAMTEALLQGSRYPKPQALVDKLAKLHRVEPEWIVLGCGSGEILRNLPSAFAREGELVAAREAYRSAATAAEKLKVPVHLVPLDEQFRHDLQAMAAAINSKTRLVVVSNPNNPTGTILPAQDLRNFADAIPKDAVYVVDEAYIHYAPQSEVSGLPKERSNVLVLRTFSKVYGLAGLRVGYGIAHPDLIKKLKENTFMYNVNAVGFAGALAALDDAEHVERSRALLRDGKLFWERTLRAMNADFVPSQAPFFLLNTGDDGEEVESRLQELKVYVRRGKDWDLPGYIRISYGTMDQNRAVASALRKSLKPST